MAMDTVTHMTMKALKAVMLARVPIMMVGAPGTGKTATVRALADEMKYKLLTVIGSQMDPTDVTGLPSGQEIYRREDGTPVHGTVYLAPWWQVEIMKTKRVILFLDEFSNTSSSTRAALLTLLQNREFPNGEKMPEETIVMGAMNPVEQAADGYELDMPTTNRIFFISWNPSVKSWVEGMLNAWGQEVSQEESMWRRKIVSFIQDNPTWLHQEPNDAETTEVYNVNRNDPSQMEVLRSAWASRRTWDKLSQVLAHTDDDISVQDLIMSGLVGFRAAAAFREWLRRNDVVDPNEVMNNPKKFDFKKMTLDDSNLVLRSIVEMADKENSAKVCAVFHEIAEQGRQDLGAPFMTDLLKRLAGIYSKGKAKESEIADSKNLIRDLIMKYREVGNRSSAKAPVATP